MTNTTLEANVMHLKANQDKEVELEDGRRMNLGKAYELGMNVKCYFPERVMPIAETYISPGGSIYESKEAFNTWCDD